MIHVILDTSIYRQKPRLDSPEFRALSYLANKGCLQLHVPYFVEKEFCSWLEYEQCGKTKKAEKLLTGILNYDGVGTQTSELKKYVKHLQENLQIISTERKASFINWLKRVGAERYSLVEDETCKALDAYFYGKPPLKEPKVRKDIPDSFIFQTILNLKDKYGGELHVVIHDGNLREACRTAGINYHSELKGLLNLPVLKECLTLKIIEDNSEKISEVINEIAEGKREQILSKIEYMLLSDDYGTISGNTIPGESNEIYVSNVNKPREIDFSRDVEYFGDGLFALHFTSIVELLYEFAVFIGDAYHLDTDKFHVEPLNEHYMNVETTDEFQFSGRVELEFDVDVGQIDNIDDLEKALVEPNITTSELDDFEVLENI